MIESKIIDGTGSESALKITEHGQVEVIVHGHPPLIESKNTTPLREYFTDSTGAIDMRVDGSSIDQIFNIKAEDNSDIYIKSVSVVIADAGATLRQFGSIGELTNGVEFSWETQQEGKVIIHEALKSNFNFVRLANGQPSFGSGNSAFKANNVVGNSEAFFMSIDLTIMSGQWGLRLRKGTNDALTFTIRDDVSGVDGFDCIAYGIRI